MFERLFTNVSEADKNEAVRSIIQHASPRQDFYLMLVLAIAMASFGVILGNTVILIGSMLIAPLLYPVLSLALGIIVVDRDLIQRSVTTIATSVLLSLAAGFVIGILFAGIRTPDFAPLGIEAGGGGALAYALVAVIAGLAAAFALTKPHLNEVLPGVAIAVTLVPPLAVAGVGISLLDWAQVSNALLLFAVNGIGIMFSALIVFALMRLSVKKPVAEKAIAATERTLEKEADLAEKS